MSESNVESETILNKLADAKTPGFEVEFDPEEARLAGAFYEDALNEIDAKESVIDQVEGE